MPDDPPRVEEYTQSGLSWRLAKGWALRVVWVPVFYTPIFAILTLIFGPLPSQFKHFLWLIPASAPFLFVGGWVAGGVVYRTLPWWETSGGIRRSCYWAVLASAPFNWIPGAAIASLLVTGGFERVVSIYFGALLVSPLFGWIWSRLTAESNLRVEFLEGF